MVVVGTVADRAGPVRCARMGARQDRAGFRPARQRPGALVRRPQRDGQRDRDEARGAVPDRSPDRGGGYRAYAGLDVDRESRSRPSRSRPTTAKSTTSPCVTWTAAPHQGIPVGNFETFQVSIGLPDDATSLNFPTIQTYSNGQSVSWVQVDAARRARARQPRTHDHVDIGLEQLERHDDSHDDEQQ